MATAVRDPNTLSNYGSWLTKHTTASLSIDFEEKLLRGKIDYELISRPGNRSQEIVLDSSFVAVKSVTVGGSDVKWELRDRVSAYGSPLHISLPDGEEAAAVEGGVVKLSIEMSTTKECTALQWLTPEQTSNRKHPYMFSQCQAIHARSLFPCQDTPDVKSTYSFNITSGLPVVASGILKDTEDAGSGQTLYRFEQDVPIPSYLFALASGDIKTAQIGPRSKVATGPDELEGAKWELEKDMEKFMEVAEKIVFPYRWGEYNVLVLPPSFPYGGECALTNGRKEILLTRCRRDGEPHLYLRHPHHHQWRPPKCRCHCPRTCPQLEREPGYELQLGALLVERGLDRVPRTANRRGHSR